MGSKKDLYVGKKIGRWTILKMDVYNPNSKAKKKVPTALCQCECGTQRYKEYRDLYSGRSLSCGCLRTEQVIQRNYEKGIIPIGTRFGHLIYIKDLGYRKQNSRDKQERWGLCKCDCGKEVEVSHNNLKSGLTKSCGCINSFGENQIRIILDTLSINYVQQYTFSDLKGCRGGALRFDFMILDKNNQPIKAIEFDGRQHYSGPEGNWKNSYTLEELQENDKRKNLYCKEHGIEIQRVPYFELSKISADYLNLKTLL